MNVSINVTVTDSDGACVFNENVQPSSQSLDAVLFDFNPTSNPHVATIKALHAGLIQMMNEVRSDGTPAQARAASIAITELEGAQMRAVKALFAK